MREVLDTGWAGESRDTTADGNGFDITLTDRRRGQTHVLGIVLLIGIVVTGSAAVVLFGVTGLDAYESAAEIERAERSLLEFTHATHTAMGISGESVPITLGSVDHGSVETDEDVGRLRITFESASGTEVLYDEPLGAHRYVNADTEIAYQGGGLWRSDGNGSVPVSSPPLEYRDGTLTFSAVRVTARGNRRGDVDGVVRQSRPPTSVDLRERDRAVGRQGGVVRIDVESAYCDGWEREIGEAVPGRVTEGCSEGRPDRVRFGLTVPPAIGTVDSAIAARVVDVHRNAPPIEGVVRAETVDEDRVDGRVFESGYDYPSADAYVEALVENCQATEFDDLEGEISEPGRYCVDTIDDDLTFDTSEGDIEVVVRDAIGDPNYEEEIRVEGENDLTIAVDGPISARADAVIGNESDPGQTQLLVSADGTVTTASGGPTVAALVYAPDSNVSVQGNPTIEGSIVADHVDVGNIRPGVIAYDGRIAATDVVSESGSPLRYFDVSAYELSIDD
ncbi:DUF7289 family protein [Natrinema halophilum]|uniref:DUF7305 domain-containing protein n=1 Tax=Natrinema halophilum TaxID=1699371 RepID=A0A7D5KXK6_9EURY|nr:hypothetical protein [Natrinema halophilum]QLG49222.1 hypothetical protein HYG82_10315 [Natrinema halophilum]